MSSDEKFKECPKHGWLPKVSFYVRPNRKKIGFYYTCKLCNKEYCQSEHGRENRNRLRREWRKNNPEKEKVFEATKTAKRLAKQIKADKPLSRNKRLALEGLRMCRTHGVLPLSDFYVIDRKGNKKDYTCKLCRKSPKEREKATTRRRAWVAKNKHLFDRRKINNQQQLNRIKTRLEVLQHYSQSDTPFCECCKENNLEFLCLDHKYGLGSEHRLRITNGRSSRDNFAVYRWARKNNYPDILRVLCHNCNMSYGAFGYCPHQPRGISEHEQV